MSSLKKRITSHLNEAEKTYFQHLNGAMKTCVECFMAGTAAMIHGFVPFLFETTASRTVKKIYLRQTSAKK